MILTGKTLVSALRPPYPYGTEFVQQFLFMLRLCWLPLTISTIAFGYGAPGLQAGNFLVLFGAIDRLGGFFVLASIRGLATGPLEMSLTGYCENFGRASAALAGVTATASAISTIHGAARTKRMRPGMPGLSHCVGTGSIP